MDISLLRTLGYNEMRIFSYQMLYIVFDVFFAIVVSNIMVGGIFIYIGKLDKFAVLVSLVDSVNGVKNSIIINGIILFVTVTTVVFCIKREE